MSAALYKNVLVFLDRLHLQTAELYLGKASIQLNRVAIFNFSTVFGAFGRFFNAVI